MSGPQNGETTTKWMLGPDEHALFTGKRGATRLSFAVALRCFVSYGRFAAPEEIEEGAVEYVASQVDVAAAQYRAYDHHGRTAEYHRAQIPMRLASGQPPSETPTSWRRGCWRRGLRMSTTRSA